MIFQNLNEFSQATLEMAQSMILPILGVCLAVSIVFLILQVVLSIQDFNFQFLIRFVLLIMVCVFMAKGVAEKYVEYTRAVFKSAPEMVR